MEGMEAGLREERRVGKDPADGEGAEVVYDRGEEERSVG